MRYSERQRKVENSVYEAVDEIADELDLEIPFYPEVYWIGRSMDFDSLGINEKYRAGFKD